MAVSVIAAARAVLVAALPGVNVSYKAPDPLTQRFIRVSRAGGPRGRDIDSPRIIVECYASTTQKSPDGPRAEQDAYDAVDALLAAANGGPWANGWITGFGEPSGRGITVADYPDPTFTQHARWQFTGTLYLLT